MQAVNLLNASDAAPVREISDADAPHRINVSNIWSLPFGKGRAFMSNANPVVSRLAVERSLFEQTSTWPQGERLPLHRGYWRNVCKVTLPARLLTAAVC